MRVVIVGGGIIGVATAYYLLQRGDPDVHVTIIERNAIAGAASGKAGGFLARNWFGAILIVDSATHTPRKMLS